MADCMAIRQRALIPRRPRARADRGREREAMGAVPEQIALEEHLGDGRRLLVVQAGRAAAMDVVAGDVT